MKIRYSLWPAALVFIAFGATSLGALERKPSSAGQFYPTKAKDIGAAADKLLAAAKGPPAEGEIVALLVPHAGWEFSGAAAAKAYAALGPGRWDSVIIVGTAHTRDVAGAALYPGAYATPEGALAFDEKLAAALEAASPLIRPDAAAHEKEHSIEVQLPFLRKRLGAVKLVALIMNAQDLETARAVGSAIASAARGKRVLLVASSDLSHYPEGGTADLVDQTTLAALASMDPAYFWLTNRLMLDRSLPHLDVSYCGEGAVTAVMTAAGELGADRFSLLSRYNSGDVVSERDYRHVVGYASGLFLRTKEAPALLTLRAQPGLRQRLLQIARHSIEDLLSGAKVEPIALSSMTALNLPAAVFVTINGPDGALRGCVGQTRPEETLAEAVAHMAQASATQDARFAALKAEELAQVRLEISVLSRLKPVKGSAEVSQGDGVLLEQGGRTGVFLPRVWSVLPDKKRFLEELCHQKAGLPVSCADDPATRLSVFSADILLE